MVGFKPLYEDLKKIINAKHLLDLAIVTSEDLRPGSVFYNPNIEDNGPKFFKLVFKIIDCIDMNDSDKLSELLNYCHKITSEDLSDLETMRRLKKMVLETKTDSYGWELW